MTAAQGLLDELTSLGVTVRVEGAVLKLRGYEDVLTDERLAELREHKVEIIALLEGSGAGREPYKSRPYITPEGELRIGFDSDPKYHWWKKGGQHLGLTLKELNAPPEVLRKYVSLN